MRDKERIGELMRILEDVWLLYPDMRFNQLIDMLQRQYMNGRYVREGYIDSVDMYDEGYPVSFPDLFYVEDDKFYDFLYDFLKKNK